jgi:hypothetical protein
LLEKHKRLEEGVGLLLDDLQSFRRVIRIAHAA